MKHRTHKPTAKAVATILCAALMLTACGSKETTSNETASTETTSVESTVESTTETTVAEPTAEPAVEPTEAPTESETVPTETAPAESPAPTVEPTAAPVESTDVSTGYTYSELSKTMYAKSAVNVRDMPSTDGKKIGSLKTSQEITVTGKCDQTGWYRFDWNNTTGYVSDKYIVSEKPAVNTVASTGNNNATANTQQNAVTPVPAQTTTTNTTPNSSEPFFDRTMAEQIFALVNADRVANGLNALEWSEDDYNIAMQRCCEDDGHNSMRGGTSENYASGYTSAQDVYQGWHDSTGHHNNYLNATYTKSAVAARFTPLAGGALGYGTAFYQVFTWDTDTTACSEPTIVTNTEAAAPKTADENTDTSSSNVGWSMTPPTQEDGLKKWQEQNPDVEVSFGN